MQRAILAVSPNVQFLEQIRSHLEEGGRYRVQGVTTGGDALALVRHTFYDLAILDAESSDVPFVPFTRDMVAAQPGLKLLVFPPQNNPHHPVLAGLVANGFLKKPFFTPEVSRALKDIFDDKSDELPPEPEPITNLAELWMKRPEVGFNRVEQLLGSTTAHTGLLIARGKVIAGSGPIEDSAIQQVLNLLDIHRLEKDNLELMRFLTLENESSEILLYASQLIPEVILVLFYPATTSIQLARQEVRQVKQEFKEAYPNTHELRKDLDIPKENRIPAIPVEPVVEDLSIQSSEPTQSPPPDLEPIKEKLIPLEDEIGSEDLDTVLSLVELKNLDTMLAEMPPPDPDQVEDSRIEEPAPLDDLDLSNWLPLPEEEKAQNIDTEPGIDTPSIEETSLPSTPQDIEQPVVEGPPPLPDDYLNQIRPPVLTETEPKNEQSDKEADVPETEFPPLDWNKDTAVSESIIPDSDYNIPWDFGTGEEVRPTEEGSTAQPEKVENIEDDAFNAWLNDLHTEEPVQEEKEPAAEEDLTPFPHPPITSFLHSLEGDEEENPAIGETEIPESIEDVTSTVLPTAVPTEMESDSITGLTEIIPEATPVVEEVLPPAFPTESFNEQLSSEPGTSPLGIRNFRFNYTCLLIPRNPKHFLTRDLNERLSFMLPQFHLEYGWHLTGIAIRPQYMLWSISVPLDTCPIDIIHEIRRRTSAHIFANFHDLTSDDQSDFWAPGFLALSGSTSPSVGMIYDFITQTRENQRITD
jgi:REP element-mobilizing transposase RayT